MEYVIKNKLNEIISNLMLEYGKETNEELRNEIHIKLELYRSIKNAITVEEKKTGNEIKPEEEAKLLMKLATQRKDSIEQYKQGGRQDLVEKEEKELAIISEYLPKEPTEEEITKLVKETIAKIETENGAKVEMRNMKDIMAAVKQVYPTVDGKLVSGIVKSSIA